MGIKLADTLEPMGNFPAAKSSDVELTLLNGSKKRLQDAYNDGDLGGGSGSSTDPSEYIEDENGEFVSTYVEMEADISAPSGNDGMDYGLPYWNDSSYIFVVGEYGKYNGGKKDQYTYWHEKFCGYHYAFLDKKEGKLQMYIRYNENTFMEDLVRYKICLVYSRDDEYYTFREYDEYAHCNLDSSIDWYDDLQTYTHKLNLIKEICEAKDAFLNKRVKPDTLEIVPMKTGSDSEADGKLVYFVKGEVASFDRDTWATDFVTNNDAHLGFLNEFNDKIVPWIERSEFGTYNKICLFRAVEADGPNWNGRTGENNLELIEILGNTSEDLISDRKIWIADSNDLIAIPNPSGITSSSVIRAVIEADGVIYGSLKSPNKIIVLRNLTTGWETLTENDESTGFDPFGVSDYGLISLDSNRLIAISAGTSSPKLFTLNKTTGAVTVMKDFSTLSTLTSPSVSAAWINPDNGDLFVSIMSYSDKSSEIWKTTDESNWTRVLNVGPVGPSSNITPSFDMYFTFDGDVLIACNRDGIYRSTDGGDTFTKGYSDTAKTYARPLILYENGDGTGIMNIATTGSSGYQLSMYEGNCTYVYDLSTDVKLSKIYETKEGLVGVSFTAAVNPARPASGTGVFEVYKLRNQDDWTSWIRTFRDPNNKQWFYRTAEGYICQYHNELFFHSTSVDNQGMFSLTNADDVEYNRSIGTCGRYPFVIDNKMIIVNTERSSGDNYYSSTVYYNIN